MTVSAAEVEAFWRDGVVCLRGVMPATWLERMAAPVERATTTDLTEFGENLVAAGATRAVDEAVVAAGAARGHFKAGTDHWVEDPEFLAFAVESPLGDIVAELLRTEHVWLYEDSVLVKEPGTQEKTAFHQDMAYFHLDGDLVCTTWVPLDPVTSDTGAVRYVLGSHLDRTKYRPGTFVTDLSLPDTEGEDVPDFDRVGEARIASFDTEPGDVVVHHARTIHGAHGNRSATQRRRAISVRYAGDGTVFRTVPGGLTKPHHDGVVDGEPLGPPAFPIVR